MSSVPTVGCIIDLRVGGLKNKAGRKVRRKLRHGLKLRERGAWKEMARWYMDLVQVVVEGRTLVGRNLEVLEQRADAYEQMCHLDIDDDYWDSPAPEEDDWQDYVSPAYLDYLEKNEHWDSYDREVELARELARKHRERMERRAREALIPFGTRLGDLLKQAA